MLACLIAAGVAAASVFALRGSHKGREEEAHVEEASEVPARLGVAYLKSGDNRYCARGPGSLPARCVLMEEAPAFADALEFQQGPVPLPPGAS